MSAQLAVGSRVVFTDDLSRTSMRSLAGTVTEVISNASDGRALVLVQWDDGELAVEYSRTLVAL